MGLELIADFLQRIGRGQFFMLKILAALPAVARRPRLVVQQLYAIGALSLIIIVVSGSFVGMVLALQGYNTLVKFGAEQSLGLVVALSVVRELGPVVTGLLFSGRAGSSVAAEIGLMKATEQLAGMEMMAVDPVRRIIAPRFVAGVIAMPLLTAIFNLMAIGWAGGHFIGVDLLGVDPGAYWSQVRDGVSFYNDILNGLFKSLIFGIGISWIAVYQGYHAEPTSEGVSRATTRTVVMASLAVLALDFVLTALMFRG